MFRFDHGAHNDLCFFVEGEGIYRGICELRCKKEKKKRKKEKKSRIV